MTAHTEEQFQDFMAHLKPSNQTLASFCDFAKIEDNVDNIRLSLCMLNSLIGAYDLEAAVRAVWARDRSAFSVMGILIAVRDEGKKSVLDSMGKCIKLHQLFESPEGVLEFLNATGLAEIFQQRQVKDLVDYVFGIETGLDSNSRKNRGGHVMETTIEEMLTRRGIQFEKEVSSTRWEKLQSALGDDEKRFDFVIEKAGTTYLMEVNFYNGGGSKLNEVARSYSELAPKINAVEGFEFVWITDGVGWKSARGKLQEAYNTIPRVYNLENLEEFLNEIA